MKLLKILLFELLILCLCISTVYAQQDLSGVQDPSEPYITYESLPEGIIITGYTGTYPDVVIPESIDNIPVVKIAYEAFRVTSASDTANNIKTVSIPQSVKEIGDKAFYNMSNLKSVYFNEGIQSIGSEAFANSSINNINLPSSVRYLGDGIFHNANQLTQIELSEGITTLGTNTFENCSSLKSISIPASITYIVQSNIFKGCSGLTSVYFHSGENGGVQNIPAYTFKDCSELFNITLPDNLSELGESAFENCSKLKEIIIPGTVKSIQNNVFSNCTNLSTVRLNDGVVNINTSAFNNCRSLRGLFIPKTVTNIDGIVHFEESPNLTIEGYSGTVAESYANAHNIPFLSYGTADNPSNPSHPNQSDDYSYYYGTVTQVDQIGIRMDDQLYSSGSFEPNLNISDIFNQFMSKSIKKAVLQYKNNRLHDVIWAEDIITPNVGLNSDPSKVSYENGKFDKNQIKLSIMGSIKSSFLSGLPEEINSQLFKDVPLNIVRIEVEPTTDGINFGQTGQWWFKENVTHKEFNVYRTLSGISQELVSLNVEINKNYIPPAVNNKLGIKCKFYLNDKETPLEKTVYLTVANLDKQLQDSKTQEENTPKGKQRIQTAQKVKEVFSLANSVNLGYYFNEDQVKEIMDFANLYIGTALSIRGINDKANILDGVLSPTEVQDLTLAVAKRLGIKNIPNTIFENRTFTFSVKAETLYKKVETVTFKVNIGQLVTNKNDPSGSFGSVEVTVSGTKPVGALSSERLPVTYYNADNAADTMAAYIKIAYDANWGDDLTRLTKNLPKSELISKLAEYVSDETISLLMKGEYSNTIYTCFTRFGHKTANGNLASIQDISYGSEKLPYKTKEVCICGDADIEIFNSSKQKVGSVINGEININDNQIYIRKEYKTLYRRDDSVYIYLGNDNYNINLVPWNNSKIDYSITALVDGNKVRELGFQNQSLTKGVTYTSAIPFSSYLSKEQYELTDLTGTIIPFETDKFSDKSLIYKEKNENSDPNYSREVGPSAVGTIFNDGVLRVTGSGPIKDYNRDQYSDKTDSPIPNMNAEYAIIENNITEIGKCSFYKAKNLKVLEIGDGVTRIGDYAFEGCDELSCIYIGKNVQSIGKWCFSYCPNLNIIYVDPENPYLMVRDRMLYSKDGKVLRLAPRLGLTEYNIPEGVEELGVDCFGDITALTSITIPSTLKTIEVDALDNTGIPKLVIPDTVTTCKSYPNLKLEELVLPDNGNESLNIEAIETLKKITIPPCYTKISNSLRECPNVTIYGYNESFAQSYAQQWSIPFVSLGDYHGPNQPDKPSQSEDYIDIIRLYNPNSLEHLYTSDKNESQYLASIGWIIEESNWKAPVNGDNVYRLYNESVGEHLYTTDLVELNVLTHERGWVADNDGYPLFKSGGSKPIYRLYHEGIQKHHLTSDEYEYSVLSEVGWSPEGVKLYSLLDNER